jgi:putative two-component system response regulator
VRRAAHAEANVLVVDDEPANVLVLEQLLSLAGYRSVRSTTDSTQVQSLCETFQPDIVLLDLRMPGLDGFEVMQRLARRGNADELPILVLTADISDKSKRAALEGGAKDFVTKPFDHSEVLARVANLLDTRFLHLKLRQHNERLEHEVQVRTADLADAVRRLEAAERDRVLAQEETIHRLSLAAEYRNDETSRHIERMSRYCAVLAEGAGWDAPAAELLRMASKMHDIGKLAIPDSILLKPGKLTPGEYEVMKGHADIGNGILRGSRSELVKMGALLAWTHHERVDGAGYPRGLRGDEIPIEGRIAAIADVFDALTTNRIYRRALPLDEAVTIMRQERGRHFDAELLDIFLDSLDRLAAVGQVSVGAGRFS